MTNTEQKVTLYDIEAGLAEAAAALDETLELLEQSPDDAELKARADDLGAVCGTYLTEAPAKRDRVAAFIQAVEAQIELCKAEKARINARQQQIERMLEGLKNHFVVVMHVLGTRKLEGNTSVLSLRKSPDKLEISSTDDIPAQFLTIEPPPPQPPPKVDRAALAKYIKELKKDPWETGDPVPGVHIVPGGDTLQVR
jgi:hypothetical protein